MKNQLSKKQKFSKKTEKTGILIPLWNLNRTNLKNVLEKDPYLKNNFKMLPFSLSVHNINIFSFQGLSDPIQNRQNCQLVQDQQCFCVCERFQSMIQYIVPHCKVCIHKKLLSLCPFGCNGHIYCACAQELGSFVTGNGPRSNAKDCSAD